ncbi:MAG: carbohydrate ABC transporter permease [Clostridia bacterium]|nr:carbohydrate ABC transporter permease [Clostridia bacterium]
MKNSSHALSKSVMYAVLLFTVIVSGFPIMWVIMSSFKTNAQILSNPFSLPTGFIFSGYERAWKYCKFPTIYTNSFTIALSATFISLVIFSMAAYVIAKYQFKGRNLLYSLFVLTLLVPTMARAQPILRLIVGMNLYDTPLALILVYATTGMATCLFVLRATFMTIPLEFSEAAWLEGAGFIKTFLLINLPMAKSGLATAGTLLFLANWNEYYYAMLLTMKEVNRTVPFAITYFDNTFNFDYTSMFAALTLVIVPALIVYAIFQEQVAASLVASGVKG